MFRLTRIIRPGLLGLSIRRVWGGLRISRSRIRVAAVGRNLLFDLISLHRNERFTVSLGKRIRLRILRTHKRRISHGLTGGDVLQFAVGGNGMIFGDHSCIVRNRSRNLIRQGSVRVIRHDISSGVIGDCLCLERIRRRICKRVHAHTAQRTSRCCAHRTYQRH